MKYFFAVFFTISFIFLAVFGVNCVYGWIFPLKYQTEVASASEVYDVDIAVINALINIESHFNKDALSSKGAVGLMQIMPTTANMLSEEENLGDFDLKSPKDNIMFGTCYLSKLLQRFENVETALAAYNAGPTNVKKWLADEKYSDDGKILKEIPFEETRNYIEKFHKNFKYYNSKV